MLHKLEMFCVRMCSLIDVCFSIFSSIILPNCILLFLFIILFLFIVLRYFFVRYLCWRCGCHLYLLKATWLDLTLQFKVDCNFWHTLYGSFSGLLWVWEWVSGFDHGRNHVFTAGVRGSNFLACDIDELYSPDHWEPVAMKRINLN